MLGLMCNLEPLENQVESWKSPGNLFLLKGTNPVSSIGAVLMIWDNFLYNKLRHRVLPLVYMLRGFYSSISGLQSFPPLATRCRGFRQSLNDRKVKKKNESLSVAEIVSRPVAEDFGRVFVLTTIFIKRGY